MLAVPVVSRCCALWTAGAPAVKFVKNDEIIAHTLSDGERVFGRRLVLSVSVWKCDRLRPACDSRGGVSVSANTYDTHGCA